MARPKKEREPTVPITQSTYDNRWHAYKTVGKKANGEDDTRHISSKDYEVCKQKLFDLEDAIATNSGHAPDVGLSPKLEDYLWSWYAAGTQPRKTRKGTRARWKYHTARSYLLVIRDYIIPNAGAHRLEEFTRTTRHAKHMLAAIAEKHSAHAALKAHRVLRSALSDAEEDDLVSRNVMRAVSPPEVDEQEEEFLTTEEGKAILAAIARRPRLQSRWLLAVTLGQRQGECLGLMWHRPELRGEPGDVDLVKGTITIREKLLRKTWEHGCKDPVACNKTRARKDRQGRVVAHNPCRTKPCEPLFEHGCAGTCDRKLARYCPAKRQPGGCYRHVDKDGKPKECPPLCPPNCSGHASTCPSRRNGGLVRENPKSKAGRRTVKMPRPLWDAFVQREAEQAAERERAGSVWVDTGYVHTNELGLPIDPRRDNEEWHEILTEAGVDPIKLHAARHFAATILLLLKVEKRVIMHVLGWSSDMTRRYQHILDEMLSEVAGRLEGFLWPDASPAPTEPPSEPPPSPFRKPRDNRQGSSTDHSTNNVIQFRPRAV